MQFLCYASFFFTNFAPIYINTYVRDKNKGDVPDVMRQKSTKR